MEDYFKRWILLITACLTIMSCDDGVDTGDLYGQWRWIDGEGVFVSFAGGVVCVRKANVAEVYGKYQQVGDSLFLQLYSIEGTALDTVTIEEGLRFKPMNDVRLRIKEMSGNRLKLTKGYDCWDFEKY